MDNTNSGRKAQATKGGPTAAQDEVLDKTPKEAFLMKVESEFAEAGLTIEKAGEKLIDAVATFAIGFIPAWQKGGRSFDEAREKFRDLMKSRTIDYVVDRISEERPEDMSLVLYMRACLEAEPRTEGGAR